MQKLFIPTELFHKSLGHLMAYFTIFLMMHSCAIPKSYTYFKTIPKDTVISSVAFPDFESNIQKKDILGITVSSLNAELDMQFNGINKLNTEEFSSNQLNTGFFVDETGQINIHFLGKLKVEGMTKKQLKLKLEKDLQPYLKEPIVTIQFLNKKVTVIGSVASPKVLYINEEQLSLFDVLVNCGDLKDDALASDIMIIRDSADQKIIKHINLEDHSVFSSTWYYIKPNDLVYVKKDIVKYDKEERRSRTQTTVSMVASLVSLFIVVLNTLKL